MSGELILLIFVIIVAAVVVLSRLFTSRSGSAVPPRQQPIMPPASVPPVATTTKPSKTDASDGLSRDLGQSYQSVDEQDKKAITETGEFNVPRQQPIMPPASVPPASPPQAMPPAPPPAPISVPGSPITTEMDMDDEAEPEPEAPPQESDEIVLDDLLLDPSFRGGGGMELDEEVDMPAMEVEEAAPPPPQSSMIDDGLVVPPPRPTTPPSREETVQPPTPQAPPQPTDIFGGVPPTQSQNEAPPAAISGDYGGGIAEPPQAAEVQFAAYYPKEVQLEEWKPLTAYVYKLFAAGQIAEDAKKQLGPQLAGMRTIHQGARQPVQEGALITATPRMDGFQFNPPSISVGFYEDWHRLDFKIRAKGAPLNQATNGVLTFSVEGIIVADIPLAIFVGEKVGEADTATASSKPYQAIFCSYSHRDEFIVKRVERAYKALGLDYLRDVYTLKSGQDWDDQLLKLIENADIFQLFWSKTASESKYVRQEWEHALKLKRDGGNFIRPVYWEEPIPDVPNELGHIHFAFQPELDDE